MHEDDTDIVPPGVRQYENVVPRTLLDQINAAIDETRDTWQPADGRGPKGSGWRPAPA